MNFIVDSFRSVSPLISCYDKLARVEFIRKFLLGRRR
jgi:hypothetical protein